MFIQHVGNNETSRCNITRYIKSGVYIIFGISVNLSDYKYFPGYTATNFSFPRTFSERS